MIYRVVFLICLGLSGNLLSQVLNGTLLDKNTNKPIPDCLVIIKGSTNISITDNVGKFTLHLPQDNQNTSLVFTLLGYITIEYKLSEYKKDTFYITSKNIQLKEVVVSADKKNILNPKSTDAILDFDFLENNIIILTAGNGKNYLKLINDFGENITKMKVNKNTETMKHDCIGNLQLFSGDSIWQIFYDYEKLNSLNPYSLTNYNQILGHCVCLNNNTYYFQTLTYRNLRTEYFYYKESEKGKRYELVKFQDKAKIKSFELDYNLDYFLKARRDSKYTMYNETVAEMKRHLELYREQLPLDWAYNKWLGSVETGMVKADSNLFLVNFTDTIIYSVNKNNEIKYNSKFYALKYKDLLHKVYTDAEYKETYLIQYSENKLIAIKFDINTGKEISKTEIITTPYLPKKIIINEGKAYFIQKNLADDQPYKIIKYYLN